MTLVEMLVAMAATLVLLGLVAQLFAMLGSGVNGSRNMLEMADRLRAVQFALRHDLSGATVLGHQPPISPEANAGYLEVIEGPEHEYTRAINPANGQPVPDGAGGAGDRLLGDCDDILAFTTRTVAEPFVGKLDGAAGTPVQSPYAEVIYFCRMTPDSLNPRLCTLYRRQRLVMAYPAPATGPFAADNTAAVGLDTDISCRVVNNSLVPNTLGDLAKRENRFLRKATFPYDLNLARKDELPLGGNRLGEDVILTNVIAFDVRVFDPDAVLKRVGDVTLNPTDPGYTAAAAVPVGIAGAFVDLNWGNQAAMAFNAVFPPAGGAFQGRGLSVRNNGLMASEFPTYDTWSTHYETNGIDEDGQWGVDQGLNGEDDNNDGRIDEPAEAETQAPYPVPLRAIEIRIRCYEPTSKQIRQITVRHVL